MPSEKKTKPKKEKDPINIFYMIKKIYPMCFKTKPISYLVFSRSMAMLLFALIAANIMVTQIFFDAVYKASIGENSVWGAISALLFFILFRLLNDIVNAMNYFTGQVQIERMIGSVNCGINKKSSQIDPVEYENPKRLDDINKAANAAATVAIFFFNTTGLVLRYATFFIFMGFYLTSLKPALILCLLFVFLPVLFSHILRSSVFAKLEDRAAPIRREVEAYGEAASGKNFYKETRNFGAFKYLKNLLENSIASLNAAVWGANKRSALIDLACNALSFFGYGAILLLLVKYLLDGEISVGAFAAVYYATGMIFGIMEEVIRYRIGAIANYFGQLRNFLRFLEIPADRRPKTSISKKEGISLIGVSFRYPNAEADSLADISLDIAPGETLAIVGENGAGKTTLTKLITGLYKPTAGSVRIGGTDTSQASYSSLFENVSGVFQKYQRYALTLRENVQIADFGDEGGDGKIGRKLAENHIGHGDRETFPSGLDTMLSREFDGVDLSGGQWQRVALARGFYRDSDLIVLDEPTAAIDPIEESAIYKKFVEIAEDKTAIIVTHRMGSAKIARRIVVMREGKIAEIGSHDQLLLLGGLYAHMYSAQAGWYNGV
ncbi:MAG: ABC transporter ATP-binding protein/permease [Oscillospiraceae bacterium]|nr:ABC transporter ATP-binding protein/permease [Oscillospiraceae bacterium]